MIGARIAFTTCDSLESATQLARALVERRLVACVNVIPGVRSIYRWQDTIHEDSEVLLVMKTVSENAPALTAAVHELHSYDVPELVVVPVEAGSDPYLDWIAENVT